MWFAILVPPAGSREASVAWTWTGVGRVWGTPEGTPCSEKVISTPARSQMPLIAFVKLVESNPEISHTVSNLEEHFDAWSGGDGAIPLAGMAKPAAARDEDKSTKDIGDVIEAYLAQVSRAKAEELESFQRASRVDDSGTPSKPDTLEDVLARVEARRKGKGPGPATPRHRA